MDIGTDGMVDGIVAIPSRFTYYGFYIQISGDEVDNIHLFDASLNRKTPEPYFSQMII